MKSTCLKWPVDEVHVDSASSHPRAEIERDGYAHVEDGQERYGAAQYPGMSQEPPTLLGAQTIADAQVF